ncbi:tripartite tricarboxylate transporter permease [Vreelandella sp. GE22]
MADNHSNNNTWASHLVSISPPIIPQIANNIARGHFLMNDILDLINIYVISATLLGTALGIIIGALPGLGSVVGLSICLPFTFGMSLLPSLGLLLGVYSGSVFGGSISAILINSPGTPQAAATTLDGYPLALQGKAGLALGWATAASVIGGLISCAVLIFAAPQLARFAVNFGSIEIFALITLALTCIAAVSQGAMIKGIMAGIVGLMLSLIGTDPITGSNRLTFGTTFLTGGLDLISVVIGLFAISEVFTRIQNPDSEGNVTKGAKLFYPRLRMWKGRLTGLIRSSFIGCLVGTLPGTGAATSSFISYGVAQQVSRNRENFGKGEADGIIAAESSNNAVTGSAMIPTLALGIPGDVVTAILLSALVIHGITPGVQLMSQHPEVISSIFILLIAINIFIIFLAPPIVRIFGSLLKIPEPIILSGVVVLSLIGALTVRGNPLDAVVTILFGILGYFLRKADYPLAPLVIGLVLGPQFEQSLRRGLLISDGNFLSFFTHSPLATTIFCATGLFILIFLGREIMSSKAATN